MTLSYNNFFVVTTFDENDQEVVLSDFSDAENELTTSYRSFNKRVDINFERSSDELTEKNLTNIVIKLNDTADVDIATILPKFNISTLSWYGNNGSVVGYVTDYPPALDEPGVDARTSFRLDSADKCLVIRVDGDVESIQDISVESYSVGYSKPYKDPINVSYDIISEITNKGPNESSGTDADIEIGANIVVDSIEVSTGTYENGEWVIGDLPVNETQAMIIRCRNPSEYSSEIVFETGSDDEDPDSESNTNVTVVPGTYVKPVLLNYETGYLFRGYNEPANVTRTVSSQWSMYKAHPEGVCMLRRNVGGVNRYVGFSSYRNGVDVLSEAFRAPSSIEMDDPDSETPVNVPIVESKIGGISVKNGFASTVITARYYLSVMVPVEPEDPEDPPTEEERIYQSVEVFHFKHDLSVSGGVPVMTRIPTVSWNTMERNSDVLHDPDYILFAGSRVVYVPTLATVVQGTNGMNVLMTNGGTFNRIFYTGPNNITHVRVAGGDILGTNTIPYGNAHDLSVFDVDVDNPVLTFRYEWNFGGEEITSYKAFELVEESPYFNEIEIDGLTSNILPYTNMNILTIFEDEEFKNILTGVDDSDTLHPEIMVHRFVNDAGDLGFDRRVLFEDNIPSESYITVLFDQSDVKDIISSPSIG